tara:strand:+ start:179 stop:496 length:318 start_codon:yes stop_codon:yes gene_type:complete
MANCLECESLHQRVLEGRPHQENILQAHLEICEVSSGISLEELQKVVHTLDEQDQRILLWTLFGWLKSTASSKSAPEVLHDFLKNHFRVYHPDVLVKYLANTNAI